MTLPTYSPFEQQIDRLFQEALGASWRQPRWWSPSCNAWEDGDRFCVELALPGWQAGDVSLSVENGVLTVSGKREEPEDGRTYYMREIGAGQFTRTMTLPDAVDPDKAQASLKDGVLSITFPKHEASKPRQIMIQ